jgi:membrane-bound lytic murein transglycosylase D
MQSKQQGKQNRTKLLVVLGVLAVSVPAAITIGQLGKPPEEPPMEILLEKVAELAEEAEEHGIAWDLPVTRNERVDFWIDFLTGRNKERTHLWLERKGRYGPMIRERLRERGMPEDLIYLALIESGFSTRAYSRAHAVGIWQFIAETGRRYGLEVSAHVDERRDPDKATDAALDYLEELYRRFGSWYLAAAAYNSGENRVERILRQRAGGARGDDDLYWRIAPHLPRETRDYVPLMLAAGHIGKEPEKYGFTGLNYQEPLAYERVHVPGGTALRAVARAAGVEQGSIDDLNPHLLNGMTPPGRAWDVRIPVGRTQTFAANFPRIAEEERRATVHHTVRRGETLSHIAVRYGVTVGGLQAANGQIRPNRLQVGQRLTIPQGGRATQQVASASSSRSSTQWRTHQVRRGDTLWGIARRHGVTVQQLRSWNNLGRNQSRILPGQRLRVRV